MLRRGLLAVVLAGAALAPSAAAAARPHAVKLALVPLPHAALGSVARSFTLAHDSGVVPNAVAAGNSLTGSTKTFAKLGRVTGYLLDYGDPFDGGAGVTAAESSIEEYRTPADAKRGLAFWRKDDAQLSKLGGGDLRVKASFPSPVHLGSARYANLTTITVAGVVPVSELEEQFVEGRYVLAVDVSAGSVGAAKALAPKLARTLDRRLKLALAGRLHGRPAKLPAKLQKGRPAGGPDLSTLALTTADLGQATIVDRGYSIDEQALSAYALDMEPAGSFDDLSQNVEWFSNANEASFLAGFERALFEHSLGALVGGGVESHVTPVDTSGIDDGAAASIVELTPKTGAPIYFALVSLARGQAMDFVFAGSQSAIPASDVQSLARSAADRLDSGF